MTIGTVLPSLRSWRQTSRPLIFGSITSRMIRSGGASVASRRPEAPSFATVIAYPSYSNPSLSAADMEASSSMTRTFAMRVLLGFRLERRRGGPLRAGRGPGQGTERQADGEGAARPRGALDRHPSPVRLDDVPHDRQP